MTGELLQEAEKTWADHTVLFSDGTCATCGELEHFLGKHPESYAGHYLAALKSRGIFPDNPEEVKYYSAVHHAAQSISDQCKDALHLTARERQTQERKLNRRDMLGMLTREGGKWMTVASIIGKLGIKGEKTMRYWTSDNVNDPHYIATQQGLDTRDSISTLTAEVGMITYLVGKQVEGGVELDRIARQRAQLEDCMKRLVKVEAITSNSLGDDVVECAGRLQKIARSMIEPQLQEELRYLRHAAQHSL